MKTILITALIITLGHSALAQLPSQNLDGFLGIPWGATEDVAKKSLVSKANARFDSIKSQPGKLWFTGGKFANFKARFFVLEFSGNRFWKGDVVIDPVSKDRSKELATFRQLIAEKYGPPKDESQKGDDLSLDWYVGDGTEEKEKIHIVTDKKGDGLKIVYSSDRTRKTAPKPPAIDAKPVRVSPSAKKDI